MPSQATDDHSVGLLSGAKTARPPLPAAAEPPGAPERRALAQALGVWADHGFTLGDGARGAARWAERWKQALLGRGAPPAEDDAAPEPALISAFPDRPELAMFIASLSKHRRAEIRTVSSALSGLAAAFIELVLESREGLLEDARDDEEILRSVAHLEAVVAEGDEQALRLRSEQVLRVVHRKADARRKRSEARMKSLGAKLGEQRHALADPESRSATDAMTGLPSRHALEAVLERERLIAQLSRTPASVVKLAISSKPGANGRDMMDRIMGLVAERLSPAVDDAFFFGRFSGDQFLVVMPGVDERRAADRASSWIETVVGRPLDVGGRPWKAPLVGGVAECLPEERRDEWVFRADEAMEAAEVQAQRRAMRYSEL